MPETNTTKKPSWFKKWLVATRVFSLPASSMPIIFGTVLAITIGNASMNYFLFCCALIGMMAIHLGSNLLNDAIDFKKGIDKSVNPVSGGVIRNWISPKKALLVGALLITIGVILGLFITYKVGIIILWLGLIGVLIGVLYSTGPVPLKFNALGDLAVFLNFGTLGSLGAWIVQTGNFSWLPVIWSIPMSLLVIGILHANNWRDISSDKSSKISTIAMILGEEKSSTYYNFLLIGPFVVIALLIFIPRIFNFGMQMPYTFFITYITIPLALKLIKIGKDRKTSKNPLDFLALDGATAQQNLAFGLLCVIALAINTIF